MATPTISVYHDPRRKKDDGTYPIKLRVYFNDETRSYPIGIDVSEEDFKRSYGAQKPREEYKKLKQRIISNEVRTNEVKDKLDNFSFERFERKMFRPIGCEFNLRSCHIYLSLSEMRDFFIPYKATAFSATILFYCGIRQ